jgi:DivIVA domain-containing protein
MVTPVGLPPGIAAPDRLDRGDDMAFMPEDVLSKHFTATQFRRGYDEREVDEFLDEIVVELRRLNSNNNDLRAAQRLPGGQGCHSAAGPGKDDGRQVLRRAGSQGRRRAPWLGRRGRRTPAAAHVFEGCHVVRVPGL